MPKINFNAILWPKMDPNKLCEIKREDALEKGYYPMEYYLMAKSRNLVPNIGLNNDGVGIVGYGICESEY
jgi:hypothetical protein